MEKWEMENECKHERDGQYLKFTLDDWSTIVTWQPALLGDVHERPSNQVQLWPALQKVKEQRGEIILNVCILKAYMSYLFSARSHILNLLW